MTDGAVLSIVREYVGAAVSPDIAFDDLKIDSLEFIQIVKDVEQTFDITIPNDALQNIRTIRDLIQEAAEALRRIS